MLLETKRLSLKPPELSDFDNLFLLQSDPEVMRYMGHGVRTQQEVMEGLEAAIAHNQKHGFSLYCVFEKDSGAFIGRAGLIYLAYDDSQPDIEVGYALTKNAWHKGYATELAKALIEWGFNHLTVTKLVAVINPQNEASRRVCERANLRYVGRSKYRDKEVALYDINKQHLNKEDIVLVPATLKDYPVMQNMARFYVYDMSEYLGDEDGWQIPKDGLYECIDLRKYWDDKNAFPFFIHYQNELAGFAIIDKKGSDATINFNMAQFFILRKFKGKGIGRYAAQLCFDRFRGTWEVMVMPRNEGAYRFWRATIYNYTNRRVQEYTCQVAHLNNSQKNIFKFTGGD